MYSISGKSKKYPKLPSVISREGGACPNCSVSVNTYFDGIINNRYQKSGSWIFPRNEVVNDTDVANRNIIHPLPYLLYVLEIGFKDAGFILSGDVLNDETSFLSDKLFIFIL